MAIVIPNPCNEVTVNLLEGSLMPSPGASESSFKNYPSETILNSYRLRKRSYADIEPHHTNTESTLTKLPRRSTSLSPRRPWSSNRNKGIRDIIEKSRRESLKRTEFIKELLKERRHDEPVKKLMKTQIDKYKIIKENIVRNKIAMEKSINDLLIKEKKIKEKIRKEIINKDCVYRNEKNKSLYLNKKLEKEVDVRYMTNFTNCMEKIRSCYDCTPDQCAALAGRLHEHRLIHHKSATAAAPIPPSYSITKGEYGKSLTITTPPSNAGQTFTIETPTGKDSYTQTKITFADVGKFTISIENHTQSDEPNKHKDIPPDYKTNLTNEVQNWVHKLPLYPNEDEKDLKERERALNMLVDEIVYLAPRAEETNEYELLIRDAIQHALDHMRLKYPINYDEECALKEDLFHNLITRIEAANRKMLGVPHAVGSRTNNIRDSFDRKPSFSSGPRSSFSTQRRDSKGRKVSVLLDTDLMNRNFGKSENEKAFEIDAAKNASTVTLGKDRLKTSNNKSIGDLKSISAIWDTNIVHEDDVKQRDDTSSGYAGNTDVSTSSGNVEAIPKMPIVKQENESNIQEAPSFSKASEDDRYKAHRKSHGKADLGASSSSHDSEGTVQKRNMDTGVDKYPSNARQNKRKNSFSKDKKRKSPVTLKRTIRSDVITQRSTDICEKKDDFPKRFAYLGSDSVRCTVIGKKPCLCPIESENKSARSCRNLRRELKLEISNWISTTNVIKYRTQTKRHDIVNALMDSLGAYLEKPVEDLSNFFITTTIVTTLKQYDAVANTNNLQIAIENIAKELASKLIALKRRTECANLSGLKTSSSQYVDYVTVRHGIVYKDVLTNYVKQEIIDSLKGNSNTNEVISEITQVIVNRIESIDNRDYKDAIFDISMILKVAGKTNIESKNIAESIVANIKHIIADNLKNTIDEFVPLEYDIFNTINERPVTKNPSYDSPTKGNRRHMENFTTNENIYMHKTIKVIESWLDHVGNFNDEENKDLKKLMIHDLAEEIVDHEKLNQLAPNCDIDQDKYTRYHIYKWLIKYEIFDNFHECDDVVNKLAKQLQSIHVPKLVKTLDTRQLGDNRKNVEAWIEYSPNSFSFIENVIDVWLNEQDFNLFCNATPIDESRRQHIKTLATKLHPIILRNDENSIRGVITDWIRNLINPKQKADVEAMSDDLTEKVAKTSQNFAISETQKKDTQKKLDKSTDNKQIKPTNIKSVEVKATTQDVPIDVEKDIDSTMKEYIISYINKIYEVDDALTQLAYGQLLKTELQKLSSITYFAKKSRRDSFSPQNLDNELQYVKDISDWLKNLPIESSFNVVGNKNRIDFINNLTDSIVETEERRIESPGDMDYNSYIGGVIARYLEQLPLLSSQENNSDFMVDQLLAKVIARRSKLSGYLDSSKPKLAEFINNYVRINGRKIADDELKLEAWSSRLLKEIQKIVNEPEEVDLKKSNIFKSLSFTPASGTETVQRFQKELVIVKEVVDWLKNLPISDSNSQITALLVSDLAQKICAFEVKKSDPNVKKEFDNYINYWFNELPLLEGHDIDENVALEQLMKRIAKLNEKKGTMRRRTLSFSKSTQFEERNHKALKIKSKKFAKHKDDPGQKIVKAIDNWCMNLNFEGGNEDDYTVLKSNIAIKLYQKINALNDEPHFVDNTSLFTQEIGYELDKIFNNLPKNIKFVDDRDDLKQNLLLKLESAKEEIKEIIAGYNYKAALDATIDSSLPNPLPEVKDSGYDMYKNKLIDLFILENFDYSTNDPNRTYETQIKNKIDKLSECAQKRNAVPLSKEEIYNELYSAMYKVAIPSESIMTDKVEETKTRCEIDQWFDELPIREPKDLEELKYWDQILDTLAKRIHYIEKFKTNPDEKIHQEITKLLSEFPLQQGEENFNDLANRLVTKLKTTEKQRKCVKSDDYEPEPLKVNMYPTVPLSGDQLMELHNKECKKRGVDVMNDAVENWCSKLPIKATSIQEDNAIRDDIATDILKKLSELNSDPEIFDSDIIYDHLLSKELDNIMSKLPDSNNIDNKELRKEELIYAVRQARNMLKEEKIRHYYVDDLRLVAISTVPMPEDDNVEHDAIFDHAIDKIIRNFVEYQYNRDDEGAKHFYKSKIFRDIREYISKVKDEADPLVVTNNVVCEMSKITVPKDSALREEIEEIRMRNEVEEFLKNYFPQNESELKNVMKNQLVHSLTKILCWIEQGGHNPTNSVEMQKEIMKTLRKLNPGEDNDETKVIHFIELLKNSEPFRKAYPIRKTDIQETKILQQNTIHHSDFQNVCPANLSPIQPRINGSYQSPIQGIATGIQSLKCNNLNPTIEYPNFNLGYPVTSTPQQVTTNLQNHPFTTPSYNSTVHPWNSLEPGAQLQNIQVHNGFQNQNSVETWTSSESGAQMQQQNVSGVIHNAAGLDLTKQLPPPHIDFTNNSSFGDYIPFPGVKGQYNQQFTKPSNITELQHGPNISINAPRKASVSFTVDGKLLNPKHSQENLTTATKNSQLRSPEYTSNVKSFLPTNTPGSVYSQMQNQQACIPGYRNALNSQSTSSNLPIPPNSKNVTSGAVLPNTSGLLASKPNYIQVPPSYMSKNTAGTLNIPFPPNSVKNTPGFIPTKSAMPHFNAPMVGTNMYEPVMSNLEPNTNVKIPDIGMTGGHLETIAPKEVSLPIFDKNGGQFKTDTSSGTQCQCYEEIDCLCPMNLTEKPPIYRCFIDDNILCECHKPKLNFKTNPAIYNVNIYSYFKMPEREAESSQSECNGIERDDYISDF